MHFEVILGWFSDAIINAEMARRGADPKSVSVLERLAYTGSRAMGALEFEPATSNQP